MHEIRDYYAIDWNATPGGLDRACAPIRQWARSKLRPPPGPPFPFPIRTPDNSFLAVGIYRHGQRAWIYGDTCTIGTYPDPPLLDNLHREVWVCSRHFLSTRGYFGGFGGSYLCIQGLDARIAIPLAEVIADLRYDLGHYEEKWAAFMEAVLANSYPHQLTTCDWCGRYPISCSSTITAKPAKRHFCDGECKQAMSIWRIRNRHMTQDEKIQGIKDGTFPQPHSIL